MGEEFVSDDEFHETFEDIASASGSDEGGSDHGSRGVVVENRSPVWSPSAFESKFSIWKGDPRSINERRQRFLREKGLKSSRDEHGYAHVAALSPDESTANERSRNSVEEESTSRDYDDEHVKPTCDKCGGERKGGSPKLYARVESVLIESRNRELDLDHEENFAENNVDCRVEADKTGSARVCECVEFRFTYDERYLAKPDSESWSSLEGASSQETLSSPESLLEEERLKIRDLDSGKEFLMKRFNRDGSLDMLREVATGRDLTLDEFEKTLGLFSPVTQELHRRERGDKPEERKPTESSSKVTKRKSWMKRLRGVLKTKHESGSSARSVVAPAAAYDSSLDDTDASSVVGSLESSPKRDSSFAGLDRNEFIKRGLMPNEELDSSFWRKPQKVKVKLRQKSSRDLSDLHLSQEIVAHQGAIWTMKFSPDGRYLASAGQDRVVHVWEVVDHPLMAGSDRGGGSEKGDGEMERSEYSFKVDNDGSVKGGQDRSMAKVEKEGGSTRSGKGTPRKGRKASSRSKGPVPKLFWLSEKPMCSFRGHTEDILDLSWSRSQFLLSSSMDKTVRLWHISYDECLRIFPHNDYVTCAQFNPLDDRYFLSGSLDDKVRIWSIPDHHVVDWSDLQEMVTAVSYSPDGKKALVGSYKGTCRFYNASGNKLQLEAHIDVREENKKARGKKITGLHCMPGDPQKVLVTSNDSRVRVYDGLNLVAKYKGLRNVKSQISSSFSPTAEFIISASEDSRVLLWNAANREVSNKTYLYRRDKQLSCEEFTSKHVSVAITWPDSSTSSNSSSTLTTSSSRPEEKEHHDHQQSSKFPTSSYCLGRSPLGIFGSGRKISVPMADERTSASTPDASPPHVLQRFFPECGPKGSATTWPEEKLRGDDEGSGEGVAATTVTSPAWGLVIVTAGLGGEITTFQNYGFPVRL